jgi:hypothetical protein
MLALPCLSPPSELLQELLVNAYAWHCSIHCVQLLLHQQRLQLTGCLSWGTQVGCIPVGVCEDIDSGISLCSPMPVLISVVQDVVFRDVVREARHSNGYVCDAECAMQAVSNS